MRWFSHIVIATAPAMLIKPDVIAVVMLGSTAPDWLERVLNRLGIYVRHRTLTHYLSHWLLALLCCRVIDYHGIAQAFCLAGISHLFADALTLSGIPLSPWSDRRFHLFGGRLRTGGGGEYWLSGVVFLGCLGLAHWRGYFALSYFSPFAYDWSALYQQGLIDGAEWHKHRFHWLEKVMFLR